jgi:signal transduction histidine kinase
MQTLARRLKAEGSKAHDTAEQIASQLGAAVNQLRRLSHGLSPVSLEHNGLADALKELAASSDGVDGVCCEFSRGAEVAIPNADVATHLFRIAQEAVTNALKHSRAKNIRMALAENGTSIELRIEDDGVGLSSEYNGSDGLGLHLMPYRARLIGGALNISSKSELGASGVAVVCTMPRANIGPKPS